MLTVLQLFLTVFAIYSALEFPEGLKLYFPLGCLVAMLVVSRIDRQKSEKDKDRKTFLNVELEKIRKKDSVTSKSITGREQDFFTVESLLWPKNELLLIDAVHSIFKDLGFPISAGVNYHSVDRIVKIPHTEKAFGLEIMISEKEADRTHPKILRAIQFEREKRGNEKTFIIASTNARLPITERNRVSHVSKELVELLTRHKMGFMTTRQLYELWQQAKGGEIDIFETFGDLYSHPGGLLSLAWM
jgi:hypothetical protein